MTNDIPRLVLDANIMVSALLGTSFPFLVELLDQGVELFAAEPQLAETRRTLSRRSHASEDWVEAQMQLLATVIELVQPDMYERHEAKARLRLRERGQPDWPVLAASFETESAIWSHDKDFFGSGAPVWSTTMLMRQLEQVN